jgi:hypothetical protein
MDKKRIIILGSEQSLNDLDNVLEADLIRRAKEAGIDLKTVSPEFTPPIISKYDYCPPEPIKNHKRPYKYHK